MKQVRTRIRWDRVLIVVVFLMIIIGVVIMIGKNNLDSQNTSKKKIEEQEEIEKEEVVSKEEDITTTLNKVPANYKEFQMLEDGEYLTETGYTLVIQNGIASVEGHVIVNKTYAVPADYQPQNPEQAVTSDRCDRCLDKEVMEAFRLMQSDAASIGLNIYIASGYRSYRYQDKLYNNYSAVSGVEGADTYSARPGHSEHQTGLCFDLNSVDDSFANTDEGRWINENAARYGFIIRYPKGKESITGYQYESWHLRYVGEDLAGKLYQDGEWLTLEEYYGISSNYGI